MKGDKKKTDEVRRASKSSESAKKDVNSLKAELKLRGNSSPKRLEPEQKRK
jgi:hypothetical protein